MVRLAKSHTPFASRRGLRGRREKRRENTCCLKWDQLIGHLDAASEHAAVHDAHHRRRHRREDDDGEISAVRVADNEGGMERGRRFRSWVT